MTDIEAGAEKDSQSKRLTMTELMFHSAFQDVLKEVQAIVDQRQEPGEHLEKAIAIATSAAALFRNNQIGSGRRPSKWTLKARDLTPQSLRDDFKSAAAFLIKAMLEIDLIEMRKSHGAKDGRT